MKAILVAATILFCLQLAIAYPNYDHLGNTSFLLRFLNTIPGKLDDFGRNFHTIQSLTGIVPEEELWRNNSLGKQSNLVETAKKLNLTKLVEAIVKVGLHHVLNHEGPFTLFGPTNEAFENAPDYCNNVPLEDVIKNHVVRGLDKRGHFKNNLELGTLLPGRSVRINIYNQTEAVTACGQKVVDADNIATNGVIHIISGMMCSLYIGGAALEIERCRAYSLLSSFINATGLYDVLNNGGPFTVFAPTDSAFEKLSPDTLDHLKNNVTALKEVLLYHVVPDVWYVAGLTNGQLKTLQGGKLTIAVTSSKVKVNDATVTLPDATVSNGVVHSIDTVLLPQTGNGDQHPF